MVCVDSRATAGSYIASGTVKKVIVVAPHILGTIAGGAAGENAPKYHCSSPVEEIERSTPFFAFACPRMPSYPRPRRHVPSLRLSILAGTCYVPLACRHDTNGSAQPSLCPVDLPCPLPAHPQGYLSSQCRLYELRNKEPISVAAASKMLANLVYSYKGGGLSIVSVGPGARHQFQPQAC